MARIRSVHPGLFTDEAFVQCSMSARLLLIGLWTEADDGGVFEWKPLQLKMRIFPADSVDIPELLAELVAADIVMSFTAEGRQYGAIRNFMRFQRPKSPKIIYPVTDAVTEYVGGMSHASAVTHGEEPMNFSTDLTAAERQRRKRQRDSIEKHADSAPIRHMNGKCHGSAVTNGEMSRQMEDGGWRMEDGGWRGENKKPPCIPPEGGTAKRDPKGSRIPDGWQPSPDLLAWAKKEVPGVNIKVETEKFRDYWKAKPGAGGRKSDWDATWRNWMRTASGEKSSGHGPPRGLFTPKVPVRPAPLPEGIWESPPDAPPTWPN